MEQKKDGMNYAPKGKPVPVVKPGEFAIAAVALDHGHIYGMCNGLTEAGAYIKWVYDPDNKRSRKPGRPPGKNRCWRIRRSGWYAGPQLPARDALLVCG